MLISLDIVKNKDEPISGGQIGDGPLQGKPIDGAGQARVRCAKTATGVFFRVGSMASSSEISAGPSSATASAPH